MFLISIHPDSESAPRCLAEYEKVAKISGSSVSLRVDYKLYVPGTVTWTHNNSYVNDDRHILAQDNSLIITDLRKPDEGVYEAVDEQKRTVAKYLLSIETSKTCKMTPFTNTLDVVFDVAELGPH